MERVQGRPSLGEMAHFASLKFKGESLDILYNVGLMQLFY